MLDKLNKKVIIKKTQLWVEYNTPNGLKESPVGNYAILSNRGIILQIGGILQNGDYISKNINLPDVDDDNGDIRRFKNIFSNSNELNDFNDKFSDLIDKKNPKRCWDDINRLLERTANGRTLVSNGFKIYGIINVQKYSFGITLNNDRKTKLENEAIIYSVNESYLTLVINGKKIDLR